MDLFSETILDHYKHPSNKGSLKNPTITISEVNPLCGDKLKIDLKIDSKNRIKEIGITPQGCAISTASASLLSEKLIGKSLKEIEALTEKDIFKMLGIEINPGRIKCAMLPLVTIKKALLMKELKEKK
ncbi:MAG: iron-sulfur cluster assembly scaffold protein [Candidatus Gracilibacteria bacterium]|nr:iron-sulfur cluster assembly scaffold protein [Candidatus Gracilibacteria bacterium]